MNVHKMSTFKTLIILLATLIWVFPLEGQIRDTSAVKAGIISKVYDGGVNALGWQDAPIAALDVAELIFLRSDAVGKPIKLSPWTFDRSFQPHVGVHGPQTAVNRFDEAGAAAFFSLRLLVNISADLAGRDVTQEDYRRTFWFYKSIVYTYSLALLTKNVVDRERPDGSDSQSFFSGHSATGFCAASYLSSELSDWYDRWETTRSNDVLRSTLKIGSGIALYAGATYVGYSRMHDEKHYLSDVAIGAVVGTFVGTWMYHRQWGSEGSADNGISFIVINKIPTFVVSAKF
jgi:membrane-associated phospholipid phosphatase